MLSSPSPSPVPAPSPPFPGIEISTKKKRRPAGTPDPDAEVVSLSPRTLLESDRYVCEICNQGFQRDQNLQMHRRRHKVPWKLLKRESTEGTKKRVFVCPEPSCLHHNPCHALGDLVGIKKHFRRKHSGNRQWVCGKCSKAYAVQSDYKAHLKTCGTRGHSCDCGRVFSRVESFIEHQDTCSASRTRPEYNPIQPHVTSLSSQTTPNSINPNPNPNSIMKPSLPSLSIPHFQSITNQNPNLLSQNLRHELQLLPPSTSKSHFTNLPSTSTSHVAADEYSDVTKLKLSIGPSSSEGLKEEMREHLMLVFEERTRADDARQQAKRQVEIAEEEFLKAKRIRQQAQIELSRAQNLRDHAIKQIGSTLLQITCCSCKKQFQTKPLAVSEENSFVVSALTEGEVTNYERNYQGKN